MHRTSVRSGIFSKAALSNDSNGGNRLCKAQTQPNRRKKEQSPAVAPVALQFPTEAVLASPIQTQAAASLADS